MKKLDANQYSVIVTIICLVIIVIAFAVWWYFSPAYNNEVPELIDQTPVEPGETTTVYGVEMKNKCFDEFQSFIKTSGVDYSKCLSDVDLNEKYCSSLDPDTQGLSDVNIVVILDASGSMAERIDEVAKIDIAKKAISNFLTQMPQGVNTGLVVYGHKGSNSLANKGLSCEGVEEVVKLGQNNNNNIISAMNYFTSTGWTPIAGSIDFVKNIFKNSGTSNKNYLILVSDGIESCDGDALVSTAKLKAEVPGIKLSVIGFTSDSTIKDFLRNVAITGGGSYLTAANPVEIIRALNNQLYLIKRECISGTLFGINLRNKTNNTNNLDCWLASNSKESGDFNISVSDKFIDSECSVEISDALVVRQNEFWYKKAEIEEKNAAIYKKIEEAFNNQLKALEELRNQR